MCLEGSFYAKRDQSSSTSSCVLYVGNSIRSLLYIILHFSHDRTADLRISQAP